MDAHKGLNLKQTQTRKFFCIQDAFLNIFQLWRTFGFITQNHKNPRDFDGKKMDWCA